MNCTKCGKENHEGSKFCRFCGNKLSEVKRHIKIPISPKILVIAVVALLVIGGVVYAAPKAKDYFDVQGAITQAQKLESGGQYQQALNALTATQGKWTTSSTQNNISSLEQKEQKYIGWQNDYNTALTDVATSSYNDAQTLLQGIDSSYPQYSLVKNELTQVQTDIQSALNAKVTAAEQATKAAQQNAAAQKAAAAAAQAQAKTATQNASSQAAIASGQTANTAFFNQLSNIYNNFLTNCLGDGTAALKAYNSGTGYGVYLGAAISACNSAEADAKNLNASYSNMPTNYVNADDDMEWAAYYISQSLNAAFTQNDPTTALYDTNAATPYVNEVGTFLQSK